MVYVMASLKTRLLLNLLPLTEQEKRERWLKMEVILDHREFDCIDCNCHVYTWSDDTRERCAVCTWIHNIPDMTPEHEAEIRVLTATPILPKYRDDNFPERNCDCCGNLYKGPAVYCSHACALKDA
jgi:hypothetical protein